MLQGQVASVSCFRPVPSCYLSHAGRHTGDMASPVSRGDPVAYGESIGAWLCPVSVFFLSFTGIYRESGMSSGRDRHHL
jgi:hypothetical protein